jgi:hypothetical protein
MPLSQEPQSFFFYGNLLELAGGHGTGRAAQIKVSGVIQPSGLSLEVYLMTTRLRSN